ncbi:MAG TPA: tetratricopeptide repeat protein, partial [Thermoanaerobaculia bacterium]|nr:tetratricopeptide repeat protein [Thermoanaerobaculia bacterium]
MELNAGRPAEASEACREAHATWESLAREKPSSGTFQLGLSMSYNLRGRLAQDGGRLTDALRDLREALAIRKRLFERDGAFTEYRRELAQSYHNLGRLQLRMGCPAEAARSLKQAYELRLTYTGDNPDDLVSLACGLALRGAPPAG